ncbi:MAG: UDP-N-acetylglucosamine 1-carboxyvinyltransferase [Candidatus Zixiibacteriota bacterium]
MDKFVINGPAKLRGKIKVDGSKNAALPILAATLLIEKGETVIRNVPPLMDIYTLSQMLEYIGARVTYDGVARVVTVNAEHLTENTAPYELMRKMRGSFLVLGPLLARLGEARVSLPGGCVLGARPVDYHIKGFASLGAKVTEDSGYVIARGKPLEGGAVYFDKPSHTGTENLLYGAVMAKRKTVITNAACDPEVVDTASFLNAAGARIHGAGTPNIVVEPVKRLRAIEYSVSGDRLVAGTYAIGAAITGGQLEISGVPSEQLAVVLHKLLEMGCQIETKRASFTVRGPKRLTATNVTAFPYPGFPTDLQACISAACAIATGTSHIRDTVFVDRFAHAMEFRRLGADISAAGGEAVINGVERLQGAGVMAPDIRAGAGIALACLVAHGQSELSRVYHLDRAYYRLEEQLSRLGADIKRMKA